MLLLFNFATKLAHTEMISLTLTPLSNFRKVLSSSRTSDILLIPISLLGVQNGFRKKLK